jgi:hypothetical protein
LSSNLLINIHIYLTINTAIIKPVEVLLANIPDFKNPNQFQGFIGELNTWMKDNIIVLQFIN